MIKVKNCSDFPQYNHYAIIIFDTKSVYHEGDERSRTHPGHGYPAYTETFDNFQYLAFGQEERTKWEEKIKELTEKRQNHVAFLGQPPVKVTSEVKIEY